MRKIFVITISMVLSHLSGLAQHSAADAYGKFMQLTSMFQGSKPYSCYAIVEVRYKANATRPMRDTSLLIYKNGATYYKSKMVENIEGAEGDLLINHELKSVTLGLSDSLKLVIQKQFNIERDREFESLLDSNFEEKDLAFFNKYVVEHCNVIWEKKDGLDEISFTPKKPDASTLLSMKIRFDENSRVRYYEFTNREVYSSDMEGNSRFRIVRTIYDNFKYDNVPDIPAKISDVLEWDNWTLRLKKYKNYQLSVL